MNILALLTLIHISCPATVYAGGTTGESTEDGATQNTEQEATVLKAQVLGLAIVLFNIILTYLLAALERWAARKHLYIQAILRVLYRELMGLGLISLVIILIESQVHLNESWVQSFEAAHILLFLLAVFFSLTVFLALLFSLLLSRKWMEMEKIQMREYLELKIEYEHFNELKSTHNNFVWRWFLWANFDFAKLIRYRELHSTMLFHETRFEFIYARKLPENFGFARFLRKVKADIFVQLIEVHWTHWALVFVFFGIDALRRYLFDINGVSEEVGKWYDFVLRLTIDFVATTVMTIVVFKVFKIYRKLMGDPQTYFNDLVFDLPTSATRNTSNGLAKDASQSSARKSLTKLNFFNKEQKELSEEKSGANGFHNREPRQEEQPRSRRMSTKVEDVPEPVAAVIEMNISQVEERMNMERGRVSLTSSKSDGKSSKIPFTKSGEGQTNLIGGKNHSSKSKKSQPEAAGGRNSTTGTVGRSGVEGPGRLPGNGLREEARGRHRRAGTSDSIFDKLFVEEKEKPDARSARPSIASGRDEGPRMSVGRPRLSAPAAPVGRRINSEENLAAKRKTPPDDSANPSRASNANRLIGTVDLDFAPRVHHSEFSDISGFQKSALDSRNVPPFDPKVAASGKRLSGSSSRSAASYPRPSVEVAGNIPISELKQKERKYKYRRSSSMSSAMEDQRAELIRKYSEFRNKESTKKRPRWMLWIWPGLAHEPSDAEKLFWFNSPRFYLWLLQMLTFATVFAGSIAVLMCLMNDTSTLHWITFSVSMASIVYIQFCVSIALYRYVFVCTVSCLIDEELVEEMIDEVIENDASNVQLHYEDSDQGSKHDMQAGDIGAAKQDDIVFEFQPQYMEPTSPKDGLLTRFVSLRKHRDSDDMSLYSTYDTSFRRR